jgi:transglutaminase-like putative cysteine protease
MNPIRLDSLYYGAFALQWLALLAAFSLGGSVWLLLGGLSAGFILAVSLLVGSKGRHHQGTEQLATIAMLIALVMPLLLWPLGLDKSVFALLAGMIVANNLALKTRRNLYFSFLGSLFLLLYAASRSYSNLFTLWITLYVLAGVFTLMLAHTDARLDASLGDPAGHAHFSWLAVFLVSVCLLLTTGVIYLLFPRLPPIQVSAFPSSGGTDYDDHASVEEQPNGQGNQGEAGGEGQTGAGRPGESRRSQNQPDSQPLDIGKCGGSDRSLMFYLQADRPLYVRTRMYDHFDGTVWTYSEPKDIALYRPQQRFVFAAAQSESVGETVYQQYIIQGYGDAILPTAARPVSIQFPGNTLRINREGGISAVRPLAQGTSYTVQSYRREVAQHLADGNTATEIERQRYLQIPPQVTERTARLTVEITAPADNDLQRAILIESYLNHTYPYSSTSYGQQPASGLVEWFLFEKKTGHCELYASAMVMMLRQLGIPARFVTGYVSAAPNPITGYQEVRNPGHAWVEAWLPPHGWVTFEPTATWGNIAQEKSPLLLVSLIHYLQGEVQRLEQESDRDHAGQGFLRTLIAFLQTIWLWLQVLLGLLAQGWEWLRAWLTVMGAWLAAAGSFSLAAWFILRPWLGGQLSLLRLRMCAKQGQRERILLAWYEMEKSFCRIGQPRQESETPWEYQGKIDARLPELQAESAALCTIFHQARYGVGPLTDSDTEQATRIAAQLIRTTMRSTAPNWLARILQRPGGGRTPGA